VLALGKRVTQVERTTDECLPFGSLDAATLRMLLEQERTKREELTQEVRRLRAGLVRQNGSSPARSLVAPAQRRAAPTVCVSS
jgi:hypothetical protein